MNAFALDMIKVALDTGQVTPEEVAALAEAARPKAKPCVTLHVAVHFDGSKHVAYASFSKASLLKGIADYARGSWGYRPEGTSDNPDEECPPELTDDEVLEAYFGRGGSEWYEPDTYTLLLSGLDEEGREALRAAAKKLEAL